MAIKLSPGLASKLDFYRKAGTLKPAAFRGAEMKRIVEFLGTTSGEKIAGITEEVRTQIRRVLSTAQANQLPFISAVNELVGATDLERGAFRSVRRRAAFIAKNELHRARVASMFGYAVDQGYDYFVWISVLSKGSCPICRGRHGKTRAWGTWLKLGIPPAPHPGCACALIPGRGIPIPKSPLRRSILRRMGYRDRVLKALQAA